MQLSKMLLNWIFYLQKNQLLYSFNESQGFFCVQQIIKIFWSLPWKAANQWTLAGNSSMKKGSYPVIFCTYSIMPNSKSMSFNHFYNGNFFQISFEVFRNGLHVVNSYIKTSWLSASTTQLPHLPVDIFFAAVCPLAKISRLKISREILCVWKLIKSFD